MAKKKINLQGSDVRIISNLNEDFISITDIAKSGEGNHYDIVPSYF